MTATEKICGKQINLVIDGRKVSIGFTQEYNPKLSALVRNTLLDAYIRKNGLNTESKSA